MRAYAVLFTCCLVLASRESAAQGEACGGTERWAVKVGADPGASQIDIQNPVPTTIHDLVALHRPSIPNDETTRVPLERVVRVVDGHLVKFKHETGKTGDSDFHLVISDETLLYSAGGAGTTPSPHSVVAEIPDPSCVAGKHGDVPGSSRLADQMAQVRAKFMQQFPDITDGWNDAGGIPVRLTGVTFFDKQHGQVGRSLEGLELHPLLDIEFNPTGAAPAAAAAATTSATSVASTDVALSNPGFEDGRTGWTASADVITGSNKTKAHGGRWKAWLGGFGEKHVDTLSQSVTLPSSAHAIALSYFLHIDTEENRSDAYDKLRVRIRDANGKLLKTVKTFSNQDAAPGFQLQTVDLTAYKGRKITIEFVSQEDGASPTSFVLDDFRIVAER